MNIYYNHTFHILISLCESSFSSLIPQSATYVFSLKVCLIFVFVLDVFLQDLLISVWHITSLPILFVSVNCKHWTQYFVTWYLQHNVTITLISSRLKSWGIFCRMSHARSSNISCDDFPPPDVYRRIKHKALTLILSVSESCHI